jgi:hypothetical protein
LILAPVCWISMVGTFIFLLPFCIAGNKKAACRNLDKQRVKMQLSLRRRTASVHGLFLPVEEYEK